MSDSDDWRYDVDEVGQSADDADRPAERPEQGEGVFGRNDGEFADPEPQSIAAENVFFVVLGAVTMVGIIALLVV